MNDPELEDLELARRKRRAMEMEKELFEKEENIPFDTQWEELIGEHSRVRKRDKRADFANPNTKEKRKACMRMLCEILEEGRAITLTAATAPPGEPIDVGMNTWTLDPGDTRWLEYIALAASKIVAKDIWGSVILPRRYLDAYKSQVSKSLKRL